MVTIEIDVVPKLIIFSDRKYAVITLNDIQISKFIYESYMTNSRNAAWETNKKDSKICMDFYKGDELINVVRNYNLEIVEG